MKMISIFIEMGKGFSAKESTISTPATCSGKDTISAFGRPQIASTFREDDNFYKIAQVHHPSLSSLCIYFLYSFSKLS